MFSFVQFKYLALLNMLCSTIPHLEQNTTQRAIQVLITYSSALANQGRHKIWVKENRLTMLCLVYCGSMQFGALFTVFFFFFAFLFPQEKIKLNVKRIRDLRKDSWILIECPSNESPSLKKKKKRADKRRQGTLPVFCMPSSSLWASLMCLPQSLFWLPPAVSFSPLHWRGFWLTKIKHELLELLLATLNTEPQVCIISCLVYSPGCTA